MRVLLLTPQVQQVKTGDTLVCHLTHWQASFHPRSMLVCSRSLDGR